MESINPSLTSRPGFLTKSEMNRMVCTTILAITYNQDYIGRIASRVLLHLMITSRDFCALRFFVFFCIKIISMRIESLIKNVFSVCTEDRNRSKNRI